LRSVAEATGLTVETIIGPGRTSKAAQARAVAAYLLRNDAGLSALDTARVLHRKRPTLKQLIVGVEQVMGSSDPRAQLLERTRRLFKNGFSSGKTYPPLPVGTAVAILLPGLLACRLAAGLTQPQLAQRAGIARETLARLERLRRRARPETVDALAQALEVSRQSLTAATEQLSGIRTPARNGQPLPV
jgi:chromosomal replication initiation ATPase DnaA